MYRLSISIRIEREKFLGLSKNYSPLAQVKVSAPNLKIILV